MNLLLLLMALLPSVALAQTAPVANSITNTSAGQATGTVLNSNQQINQLPLLQQEYGAGFRCQSSTLSISPYYVGSSSTWDSNAVSGFGGAISITLPLDSRGVEYCMAMAKVRVEKENFDLEIVRTIKCLDLLKNGAVFTSESTRALCAGIAYNKNLDYSTTKAAPLSTSNPPQQVILTR